MEWIGWKTYLWIFIVAITSLGSAQYAIHETKQRTLNLCEEQVLIEEAYQGAKAACESQVVHYKTYEAGYTKLETALNEWIKVCKNIEEGQNK